MTIRTATPHDFDALDAFDCFGGDRRVALVEGRCLVAEADGRAVGFVVFAPQGLIGRDFVELLAVHPNHRRQGIALSLLRAVEQRLDDTRLFISTEADNTPMLALLKKDAWNPAGQIEGVNHNGIPERFFYRQTNK